MGDSFVADTQYGDLQGTAAIDGHETGGPLHDLAEYSSLKPGYFPIGFGLHRLDPLESGKLPFTIYAVKTEDVGGTAEEMTAYARQHGKLPVKGFEGEIEPAKFQQFFKRFSLRVHNKWLNLEPDELDIVGYDYGEESV
jgi:hypothetical protein